MLAYMRRTEETGDLPLYDQPTYDQTLEAGRFAGEEDVTMPEKLISWKTTPTQTLDVGGTPFAYRELGPRGGTPAGVPAPLHRGPGRLGPARHRRRSPPSDT